MERIMPKQVIIEATSACNLQCKYCPNVCNDSFPVGNMKFDFLKTIVDRIYWPCTVIPWMNGEPFLNPEYGKMVKYLNERHQRFYVTTNLTIWRQDVLEELLKKGSYCYQLIVSMDGLPDTGNIAKARPGTNEVELLASIRKLLELKKTLGGRTEIAFKICERGQDWGEIEKYIKYWLEDDRTDFVVVGKPLKDENAECMRTEPCQYSDNNFMVIRWNGMLSVCAYNDKAANKGMLSYGTLNETDNLIDVYNNETITKFREDQRNGEFHEPCRSCSFAYTGEGYKGEVAFRSAPDTPYFFHQDYYNSFFSKKKNWKPDEYYVKGVKA
jgi:MoaA/NifB/PqqE/SkfB family radical SAM enzyme